MHQKSFRQARVRLLQQCEGLDSDCQHSRQSVQVPANCCTICRYPDYPETTATVPASTASEQQTMLLLQSMPFQHGLCQPPLQCAAVAHSSVNMAFAEVRAAFLVRFGCAEVSSDALA